MANKIIVLSLCLLLVVVGLPVFADSPASPNPQIQTDFKTKDKIVIYIAIEDGFHFRYKDELASFEARDALCERQRSALVRLLKGKSVSVECYSGTDYMAVYAEPVENVIALKYFLTRQMLGNEKIATVRISTSTKTTPYHQVGLPYVYKYSGNDVYAWPETYEAMNGPEADTVEFLRNHLPFKQESDSANAVPR